MKLRSKKPLVVSVGGMAASGGYYLACAANKIVVEPTSIVGSIGVVGGKFAMGKALEEIGVHAETVAASPDPKKAARATYMSALTPWDDATREKIRASMTSVYDLFLRRIAEGRGAPVATIEPSAEGRIFAGVEAKKRGLVDELGGFQEALKIALDLAKLPEDTPVDVVDDKPALFDLLAGEESDEDAARARSEAAREAGRAALGGLVPSIRELSPEVGTWLGTMAPLLSGERALAAMPFALTIR
jgi:protease-4